MKEYHFRIRKEVTCYGYLFAEDGEEAKQKMLDYDYEEIYRTQSGDFDFDTFEIESEEDIDLEEEE